MPFDYVQMDRLTNPAPTSWDPTDPEEELWKRDQQGLPAPPAIPMGDIPNPSVALQSGPVQPPPLTYAPPTLQPQISDPLGSLKPPKAMGGISPAPTLSADHVDTPEELRLKMAQAQSVRPERGMYERGGVRGVLGKIIQAAAPLAGAFGINPGMIARGGEVLEAPGFGRAMGEWASRTGALQQAQDEAQKWERLKNERAYHEAITANTAANQAALAESRRQAQAQREEGMRTEEMARLRQQDWRPLPTLTSPTLQVPPLSAMPGLPVNVLPGHSMSMPSQQIQLGVQPGFIPASIPRSRFSPEMIAGQIPTDETAARLKAQEVASTQVESVPNPIRSYFKTKHSEDLPDKMSRQALDDYIGIYKAETGQDVTRSGQGIKLELGGMQGDRQRENRLQSTVQNLSKEFLPVYNSYRQIAGADPNNAKAQLSALYAYIKLLDPNSVVREGEIRLAREANPTLANLVNMYKRVWTGTLMTPAEMKKMQDEAKRVYGAPAATYASRIRDIRSNAENLGLETRYIMSGAVQPEDVENPKWDQGAPSSDDSNEIAPVLIKASKRPTKASTGTVRFDKYWR